VGGHRREEHRDWTYEGIPREAQAVGPDAAVLVGVSCSRDPTPSRASARASQIAKPDRADLLP
jgi:hypothetical protein